jgi:hypothetical protein
VRRPRTSFGTRLRYLRAGGRLRRLLITAAGGLVLLGLAWVVITGILAQRQADAIGRRLQAVRALIVAGRIDDARAAAAPLPAMGERAQRLTTGPAWWIAAHVPGLGTPFEELRGSAAAGHTIAADAVPQLISVANRIDPRRLRSSGDTIDLAPLVAAAPDLARAAGTLDGVDARMRRLPSSSWLPLADHQRATLTGLLTSVRGYVDAAARAARVLPTMLGQDGPTRYVLGLQNEAEMRGTGGLPGAFAIAVADHGRIRFTHFESDRALLPPGGYLPTGLHFGADYTKAYGRRPTKLYVNSNVAPHFPYAARIWAAMWQRVSGERVDGAVALDPTVLSYLLRATGPTAAQGLPVTARNVVSLTQRDQYALFTDNAARKDFVVSVLKAVAHKVTSGAGQPARLAQAASYASLQHRFLVWSADPAVEAVLGRSNYSGVLPVTARPFSGLVLNNNAAGKLDYYLTRSVGYRSTGCGAQRDVVVTIDLHNGAPASGLPSYVTDRLDAGRPKDAKPGDTRVLLDYYATRGALLQSVTIDGTRAAAGVLALRGHPIFRIDLELPRATTRTVVVHLTEPGSDHGPPIVWRQPGVTDLDSQIYTQHC